MYMSFWMLSILVTETFALKQLEIMKTAINTLLVADEE
jgi:hypothetical protein